MNKVFLLCCLLFCSIAAYAQEPDTTKTPDMEDYEPVDEDDNDIKIIIGGKDVIKRNGKKKKNRKRRNVKTRWLMVDLGFSTLTQNGDFDLPEGYENFDQKFWGSTNWRLHLVQQRANLINHKLNLMYGVTFSWQRYNFENNEHLQQDQQQVTFTDNGGTEYTRNKLRTSFVTVPVMLNFETRPFNRNRSFRINAGGYAGLRLGSDLKLKSDAFGKQEIDDDFNLNNFRYGLTGQIGYGALNFYVDYSLNGLFDESENNGFELNPLNIGIVLLPF